MIPVVLVAAALVPVAAQALGRETEEATTNHTNGHRIKAMSSRRFPRLRHAQPSRSVNSYLFVKIHVIRGSFSLEWPVATQHCPAPPARPMPWYVKPSAAMRAGS